MLPVVDKAAIGHALGGADLLSRMLDVREACAGSVVTLMEVPREQIHRYGCAAMEPTGEDGGAAPPGRGGEIRLTDALQELAAGGTVQEVVFDGLRYDTGDKADYPRTVVRPACERDGLGPEFVVWLKEFVSGLWAADSGRLAA
jgi:UTP--glucose-1-phosphate uridylyltransferase